MLTEKGCTQTLIFQKPVFQARCVGGPWTTGTAGWANDHHPGAAPLGAEKIF